MPVRLFSGARSSGISFNMLHRTDKSRLKQQYVCLADGQVVDRADIVKGYEFRKDEYIIIEPEEIKKIEPQTAKTMEILEFVKASEVDPVYFESSYYMMPEAPQLTTTAGASAPPTPSPPASHFDSPCPKICAPKIGL